MTTTTTSTISIKHIACIRIGYADEGSFKIQGKGETKAEAIENCLAQIRAHIESGVKLNDGAILPEDAIEYAPKELPPSRSLLVLEKFSHNSGLPYNYRFFAVPFGSFRIREGEEINVGIESQTYKFVDCNTDYEFNLPRGSMEYVNGAWVPNNVAEYDY